MTVNGVTKGSDTVIVRLWPIPRLFQVFLIGVVLAGVSLVAWPQVASLVGSGTNTVEGCGGDYGMCAHADDIHAGALGSFGPDVDYEVLYGAVVVPLAAGSFAGALTRGRSLLGRLWYGSLFVAIGMMVRFTVMAVSRTSEVPLSTGSSIMICAAIMTGLVVADAVWQRHAYGWFRAWSLVLLQVVIVSVLVVVPTMQGMGGAFSLILLAAGAVGISMVTGFVIFRRHGALLWVKCAGLLLMATVFGGYLGGAVVNDAMQGEIGLLTALLISGAISLALGGLLLSRAPRLLTA